MRAEYPKRAEDVVIDELRTEEDTDGLGGDRTFQSISLADKINEYLNRQGQSTGDVLRLLVELMTKGKIVLEYQEYTERLELADFGDKLSRPQVATLFDDFVAHVDSAPKRQKATNKATQQIIIKKDREI